MVEYVQLDRIKWKIINQRRGQASMITTVTTTTGGEQFATIAGIAAVALLIAFLIVKELLSAANVDADSSQTSMIAQKVSLLVEKSNIVIAAMLFVFAAIVLTKVASVL